MNAQSRAGRGRVMTLAGPLPSDQMGVTLPHEHLIVQGWDYQERNFLNSAYMELVKFKQAGGATLVELSSIGRPRDPRFFKSLMERSGIHVIVGTGFYKDGWLTDPTRDLSVEAMSDLIVGEITDGIDGSGLRAGVIGEVGVSRAMTRLEERSLAASARAQARTGAAISLHFEIGVPLNHYDAALDILEANGADLARVSVGHLVARPDNLELCQHLAHRGCFLEFDLFGQERWYLMNEMMATHPEVQTSSVRGFINHGLLPRLLLSQNVMCVELMTVNGGDGYAHILKNIVPGLRSYGVTDEQLRVMLVDNPRRFLTIPE